MSQKVTTRKGAINEEKEKRQSDSPAKEMKKKMAVTAEKEKQAAEKSEKVEKSEKAEKSEKKSEKSTEKNVEKNADNKDKTDKKETKDKKETQPEKPKEDTSKGDKEKNGKTDKQESKQKGKVHNGVSDVTLSANGGADELNGGHDADDDDDVMLVIDDDDQHDHLFPELTYDTSDTECFDAPTPDAPSRSLTRRSQVKSTRTPETPRPASDKQTDKENDENKDSKVLKLKEDAPASDRKLRSSDSPKRDSKKTEAKKQDDEEEKKAEEPKEAEEAKEQKETATPVAEVHPEVKESERSDGASEARSEQFEMEVVVEVEADEEPRKLDTNYSKSRVKVSPYRRSRSIADQTTSSVMANYTGNNTTMEMDITETSVASADESALDRSFLRAIRNIRGRNSYKQLDTLNIKHLVNRNRPTLNTSGASRETTREVRETRESRETVESVSRPTAPVVGRKRGAEHEQHEPLAAAPAPKRGRLLARLAHSLRRPDTAPEIVGINTDLPLTAPVASAETFDPERLKTSPLDAEPPAVPLATPLAPHETRDNKRCLIM